MARTLPAPKVKMRTLVAADLIAHWRFEETSGTTVADDGPDGMDLTSSTSANIVDGPFAGEANNRGRTCSSTVYASGSSTAGARAALLEPYTLEAWFTWSPTLLATDVIVAHGASGETSGTNLLTSLQVTSSRGLRVVWENGAGVDVTINSVTSVVNTNELTHAAIRVTDSATAGKVDVEFFVQGESIGSVLAQDPPDGGSSGGWTVGRLDGGGSAFDGTVYEIRVAALALSDDAIHESYARGVRDFDLATVIASGVGQVFGRALYQARDGTWVDLTDHFGADWLMEMEWEDDVDDLSAQATVRLARALGDAEHSPSPFMTGSRWNADDAEGQLIDVARRMRLLVGIAPAGTASAEAGVFWECVFDGFVRGYDPQETITITLSDRMHALARAWIEPDRTTTPHTDVGPYGDPAGEAVEIGMQAFINDCEPTVGYLGGLPTLYVPTSPGWNVFEWWGIADRSVASQLQALAEQIGWLCRAQWDDIRQEFRITLYEPDRTKTWSSGAPQLPADLVLATNRLEVREDEIRNAVEVEFGNEASPDNLDSYRRDSVLAEDTASQDRWGRLYMRIGLASTTNLNESTEVQRLADAALADLSEPKAHCEKVVPFRHDIEIGDVVRVPADYVEADSTRDFAVVGYRHRLGQERTSTFKLRAAKPIGRRKRWIDDWSLHGDGKGLRPPGAPAPDVLPIAEGVQLAWPIPVNNGARRWKEMEVHVSTTSGFTPSSTTLRHLAREHRISMVLPEHTGEEHYIKLIPRDELGNIGDESAEAFMTPRWLPRAPHVHAFRASTDLNIGATTPADVVFNDIEASTDPSSSYDTSTGVWTAPVAGIYTFDASVLYDSGGKASAIARLLVRRDAGGGFVTRKTGETKTTSGSPERCTVAVTTSLWCNAGDEVKIAIEHDGNSGADVVNDDDLTWLCVTIGAQR